MNIMSTAIDPDMQNLVSQVAEQCMVQLRQERTLTEQSQMEQINALLEHWSDQTFERTKELVSTMNMNRTSKENGSSSSFFDTTADMKDRQANLLATVQESHNKQLEILRVAIADERKQFAQAQLAFEQTLKTRYECMVDALHEKVKAEQEARMQRAIDNLERSARIESERAKQSFEIQQEAEITLSQKFKGIVSDLRRSWEEEETGRAMQLEERLRSHYSVVLEHMEAQLKMALRLQDDADKQWLEDVEARNAQQIATLRAFEDKCKRLYDVRLTEYAEKTAQQIAQYEEQLLEAGSELAAEKAQFESRLRRIKLACARWKVAYQKDVHERYQLMTNVLEERYMSEVAERLQEINDVKAALADAQTSIQKKEQEIIKIHKMYAPGGGATGGNDTARLREDLATRWAELKTPLTDRVECLSALLDAAPAGPELVSRYEAMAEKLAARQPIAQLASRKQFIEYKLKLATRAGPDGSNATAGINATDRAALIAELTEVQANSEALIRQYERRFGEQYLKIGTGGSAEGPITPSATGSVSFFSGTPISKETTTGVSSSVNAITTTPSTRHSINLPASGSGQSLPSYMSPLASKTAASGNGGSGTHAPGATAGSAAKGIFKNIPPVR